LGDAVVAQWLQQLCDLLCARVPKVRCVFVRNHGEKD